MAKKKKNKDRKKGHPNQGRIGIPVMGRPTIYSGEILVKTREYIDSCKDGYSFQPADKTYYLDESGKEKVFKPKPGKIEMVKRVKLPSIDGLSVYLGVHKDTILEWRKDKEKEYFSGLINELLAKQAEALINNGLSGEYDRTISKVLLVKHGYIDRQDSEQKHKGLPSLAKLLAAAADSEKNEK